MPHRSVNDRPTDVSSHESRIKNHEERLDKVEKKLGEISTKIDKVVIKDIRELSSKFDKIVKLISDKVNRNCEDPQHLKKDCLKLKKEVTATSVEREEKVFGKGRVFGEETLNC